MINETYNIFYADDDEDDLVMFKDAAQQVSESVKVLTQHNGKELLRLLNNPPPFPTLVFLDLNMPVKNGYEVLQEIKESELTRHIPVIIFSTSDDEKAINKTRQMGACLYIPKPSSFNSLKMAIQHALSINWGTFKPSTENFVYRAN